MYKIPIMGKFIKRIDYWLRRGVGERNGIGTHWIWVKEDEKKMLKLVVVMVS